MPIYSVTCRCGNRESLVREATSSLEVPCDACGGQAKRTGFEVFSFRGEFYTASSEGRIHHPQLGTFSSAAALDAEAERRGLERLEGADALRFRESCAQEADEAARRDGFSSNAEARRMRGDPNTLRDLVAAARERKADEYHELHGQEGRASADDSNAWGSALPEASPLVSAS